MFGGGHGTYKKSKSKAKSKSRSRRLTLAKTYKKVSTGIKFSSKVKRGALKNLYKKYRNTRKSFNTTVENILQSAVLVGRAQATNLFILYRKILIMKLYLRTHRGDDPETFDQAIGEYNELGNRVIEQLRNITTIGPIKLSVLNNLEQAYDELFHYYEEGGNEHVGIHTSFSEILSELRGPPPNAEMAVGAPAVAEEKSVFNSMSNLLAALPEGAEEKQEYDEMEAMEAAFGKVTIKE